MEDNTGKDEKKHPKFLGILFKLTSSDSKVPTDVELDQKIELLSWHMHIIYPLIVSIFKRQVKNFIRYKWKHVAKRLAFILLFIYTCNLGYRLYLKPTYHKIIIQEKISEISKNIHSNPIPESNIDFMAAISLLESRSNFNIRNGQYLGAYQLGNLARKETGLADMPDSIFLQNTVIQNWAMNTYIKKNYYYLNNIIVKYKIPMYGGVRIGNNLVTISGLIAAANLVGASKVIKYVESNGDSIYYDGNHVPLTKYFQLNNLKLEFN